MSYDSKKGLLMINNKPLSMRYMKAETYQVTKSITDMDSYRDANGILHRNALEHVIYKVEFNTPPLLSNTEMSALMRELNSAFVVPKERKLLVEAYVPETDSYIKQEMYMPDIMFQIYSVDKDVIKYNSSRIAFIGY